MNDERPAAATQAAATPSAPHDEAHLARATETALRRLIVSSQWRPSAGRFELPTLTVTSLNASLSTEQAGRKLAQALYRALDRGHTRIV